jgi:phosphopantetheinyl transferase
MPEIRKLIELKRPTATFRAALCMTERGNLALLSDEERADYRRFKSESRKAGYLLGRSAAKKAVAALSGEKNLARIRIASGVFGQPVVYGAPGIEVSISHSKRCAAALAFPAEHPMGIDVEIIDGKRSAPIRRHLAQGEDADSIEELTKIWAAKEALSKVLRCGMTAPFTLFETKNRTKNGCEFANFGQYAAWFITEGNLAGAIVIPKNSKLVEAAK